MDVHDVGDDPARPLVLELPEKAIVSFVPEGGPCVLSVGDVVVSTIPDGAMFSMDTREVARVSLSAVPKPVPAPEPVISSYAESQAISVTRDDHPYAFPNTALRGTIKLNICHYENCVLGSGADQTFIHLVDADALELADRLYRLCGVTPPERERKESED
jgi:hypothetical protein